MALGFANINRPPPPAVNSPSIHRAPRLRTL